MTQGNKINKKPKLKTNKNFIKGKKRRTVKPAGFFNNFFTTFLIIMMVLFLYSFLVEERRNTEEITIAQLALDIKEERVEKIIVRGNNVEATYRTTEENQTALTKTTKKEVDTALSTTLSNFGVPAENLTAISIDVQNQTGFGYWLVVLLPFLFPIVFLGFLIWYLTRQVKGAGVQAFTFGQSNARLFNPTDKKRVTFVDVAGNEEAKQELTEIVDFLKNPKKFIEIGAQIPKGILLMGAPGTGKTLMARATAGEAGVNFFSISGSEFVEMFVGVGASRVRDLFKIAKAAAPSIIFIDEIDAVGRARGVGTGGGNDEREQTLNQILVEMDGFEPSETVIVMAATNRPDVLDPAILRPGRFDRRVVIDLPDRKDREEILKVQSRNKPLAEDVNYGLLAERTPGFSGADLYSLVNEAAILAARENRKKVSQFDFIRSIEKVMLGPERKNHLLTSKEREITAYHEAGHALVASLLPNSDPIHKISIISRGRAGGYTLKLPTEDRKLQSKAEFLDDLAMSLGGYVAEKLIFGDTTTGPSSDLQVSTAMAREMVTKYGMSDKFGPIALETDSGKAIFGGASDGEFGQKVANEVDEEVLRIMKEARAKAEELLIKYRNVLEAIAKRLLKDENLEREDYEALLEAHGISVKKETELKTEKFLDDGKIEM
jgi:cell division protease FtsH